MKHLGLSFAGAFAVTILSAGLAAAQQSTEPPIKIGIVYPLSGGSGQSGQASVKAMEAMASMINDAGGVLGRKVEVIVRDDESTPAVGVAKANEMVAAGVSAVFEGFNSPVTLAMQPIFTRANIFDLTILSQADQVLSGEGNPLAVRLNSSASMNGEATAQFIKKRGYKKLGFLVQNDVYGNGGQAALEAALKKLDVDYTIVAEQKFPFTQTDFRGALTSIKDANPEAVVVWNASVATGVPALIGQYRQMRLQAPLVAASGVFVESTLDLAGPAAEGLFCADFYFSEVPPFDKIPENQKFVAKVKQITGAKPDKYMATSALGVQIWAKAANETKSLDKAVIAQRIRGNLVKDTIFGDVTFAPNGQLLTKFFDFTVRDGKIAILN